MRRASSPRAENGGADATQLSSTCAGTQCVTRGPGLSRLPLPTRGVPVQISGALMCSECVTWHCPMSRGIGQCGRRVRSLRLVADTCDKLRTPLAPSGQLSNLELVRWVSPFPVMLEEDGRCCLRAFSSLDHAEPGTKHAQRPHTHTHTITRTHTHTITRPHTHHHTHAHTHTHTNTVLWNPN